MSRARSRAARAKPLTRHALACLIWRGSRPVFSERGARQYEHGLEGEKRLLLFPGIEMLLVECWGSKAAMAASQLRVWTEHPNRPGELLTVLHVAPIRPFTIITLKRGDWVQRVLDIFAKRSLHTGAPTA